MSPLDQTHTTILQRMAEAADLVTVALDALLPRAEGAESRLVEAMRYAVLGPGPRLRPYLALETARLFDVTERSVLRVACALECVHAYALVHDDLPALDDGGMRDGRPTVHAAYDEAVGILAGDALHSTAFEIMADPDTHPRAEVRCDLVRRLATAAGAKGLAGGRMLDLLGLGGDLRTAARMQRMKTGALIAFAVEAPLVLARATEAERHGLLGFAQDFGLAYQIVGDVKDHASARRRSGEGRPSRANLATLLGPDAAMERVAMLSQQCRVHLEPFGARGAYLRASVDFVLDATT